MSEIAAARIRELRARPRYTLWQVACCLVGDYWEFTPRRHPYTALAPLRKNLSTPYEYRFRLCLNGLMGVCREGTLGPCLMGKWIDPAFTPGSQRTYSAAFPRAAYQEALKAMPPELQPYVAGSPLFDDDVLAAIAQRPESEERAALEAMEREFIATYERGLKELRFYLAEIDREQEIAEAVRAAEMTTLHEACWDVTPPAPREKTEARSPSYGPAGLPYEEPTDKHMFFHLTPEEESLREWQKSTGLLLRAWPPTVHNAAPGSALETAPRPLALAPDAEAAIVIAGGVTVGDVRELLDRTHERYSPRLACAIEARTALRKAPMDRGTPRQQCDAAAEQWAKDNAYTPAGRELEAVARVMNWDRRGGRTKKEKNAAASKK